MEDREHCPKWVCKELAKITYRDRKTGNMMENHYCRKYNCRLYTETVKGTVQIIRTSECKGDIK